MAFVDDLLKSGFRTRYQIIQIPFRVRDVDEGKASKSDDESEARTDGLTLRGLAVPFDSPTRINDFFGEFDEQFARGAFKRTLGQHHQVMLFEHGQHPLFGSLPIADLTRLEETKDGLEVTARMYDNWLTVPLQDAIRGGSINGMSIQFRSVDERVKERDDDVPMVTVLEADLRELGPVLFPAYRDTHIELRSEFEEAVRSAVEQTLQRLNEKTPEGVNTPGSTGSGNAHPKRNNLSMAKARLDLLEMYT